MSLLYNVNLGPHCTTTVLATQASCIVHIRLKYWVLLTNVDSRSIIISARSSSLVALIAAALGFQSRAALTTRDCCLTTFLCVGYSLSARSVMILEPSLCFRRLALLCKSRSSPSLNDAFISCQKEVLTSTRPTSSCTLSEGLPEQTPIAI
jgi:hypothetical protein